MVREALFAAQVVAGASAVARALVFGVPIAAPDQMGTLPPDAHKRLQEYRQREHTFKSSLAPPRGASAGEQALYEKRVGIERVIVSLFPGRDAAKVAAGHRKLCAGATEDARRQLAHARDGGHPLIRVAALHLLDGVAFCAEH